MQSFPSSHSSPSSPSTEPDLTGVACPHCRARRGLAIALRVELETESALYIASCAACQRLFRVEPGGSQQLGEVSLNALAAKRVRCPACRSLGYAVCLDLPLEVAESYAVLTCRDCRCTFRADTAAG